MDDAVNGSEEETKYDLEERLMQFAVRVVRVAESLPHSRTGNHVASQLLRAGTSPLSNHGEAQAAESPLDFVHKMHICLKELRETQRWLTLARNVPLVKPQTKLDALLAETDELVRIFVASIRTSKARQRGGTRSGSKTSHLAQRNPHPPEQPS